MFYLLFSIVNQTHFQILALTGNYLKSTIFELEKVSKNK